MDTSAFKLHLIVVIGPNDCQNGIPIFEIARQDVEVIAEI
jgi:hypothetical protein